MPLKNYLSHCKPPLKWGHLVKNRPVVSEEALFGELEDERINSRLRNDITSSLEKYPLCKANAEYFEQLNSDSGVNIRLCKDGRFQPIEK